MKAVPERTGGKAMPVRTGGIQSAGWRRLGGEGGLPPEGPASAGPRIMPPPWLMRPSVKANHCGLWAVSASPSPGSVLASGLRQSDSEGLAPTRTSMPTQENRPPPPWRVYTSSLSTALTVGGTVCLQGVGAATRTPVPAQGYAGN